MKTYIIFSDSHGNFLNMNEAIERQPLPPDAVFFLGDGIADLKMLDTRGAKLYCVSGNCDERYLNYSNDFVPYENIVKIDGYTVMMAHGHKYGVKSGLGNIINAALERDVDILLFGHTHEKFESCYHLENKKNGSVKPLYILNPGSIGAYGASFGVISISDDREILLSHGDI